MHWYSRLALAFCALLLLPGCSWLSSLGLGRGTAIPPAVADPGDETSPEQPPSSPSTVLPEREIVVYYVGPEGAIPSSESVLRSEAGQLSYITGFWYQIDARNPARLVPMANSPEDAIRQAVALAHESGVKVEALFHNLLYGSSSVSQAVIGQLMADKQLAAELAENLAGLAARMEFDGINIDIEFVPPASRQPFTEFVQLIAQRLRREDLRVSISVPAKTSDDPLNGWAGGYDYPALGAAVDRVLLMTYDEHGWASQVGGPIASSGWTERVVAYASQSVPTSKLLVGIPAYGFRWTKGQATPVYLDYVAAMTPVWQGQASLGWDAAGNVPAYRYTDKSGASHEVWFENAASSSWKLDLVQRYGLRGFALWRAGMEDPSLWGVVAQKMRAEKQR